MRFVVACLVALPSLAAAQPITAGVSLGVANSATNADSGGDADTTVGLYGRLGFTSRISVQLELAKSDIEDDYTGNAIGDVRSLTGLLIVELGSRRGFHPLIMAGVGVDTAETDYDETTGNHIEGGFGLEYRTPEGFVLGADFRFGGRSIDQEEIYYGEDNPTAGLIYAPTIDEGEYRSARITAGIQF